MIAAEHFRDQLIRFDRALIDHMRSRVEQVGAGWNRPEIRIDVEQLRHEQADRSMRLQRAFSAPRHRERAWPDVLAALIELERRIGSVL